ncbi:hypothetical protein ACTTAM_11330 [Rhodobacter capsulatus]|uniref:hypothetical protein n=1 Tax=Rhodobacter capsulatus TaxID=1061 RepID=UPI004027D5BE
MAEEAHRITTLLPVDAETALPRFEARASAIGFASARIGGRLRVTLSGGTATVGPAPGGAPRLKSRPRMARICRCCATI